MMKILSKICLGSLFVAGAALESLALPPRTDINPAMQYYQAFQVGPDLSDTDRDYLFTNEWRGAKLPARVGELISQYDNQLKLVRQAAHSTAPCDWGIDMSPGPATLLPHLARAKRVLQASRLHAKWALQENRVSEAREDLVAAFFLARNICRDGTLISALVQVAGENMLCSPVAEDFGQFPPDELRQLLAGIDAAPARCTMASCVATEKAFFHEWLVSTILDLQKLYAGDDSRVLPALREVMASLENPEGGEPNLAASRWDRLLKAAGGTSEGILKLLREMEPYYTRLATLMALPRPEYDAQAKQFAAEVENSPNPLLSLNFPAFDKCRKKEFAGLVQLAMVRAAIEYKTRGEEAMRSVMDPTADGPFSFQRFVFEGVDRGFQLSSTYDLRGYPQSLIFVETRGTPFFVEGPRAGQPVPK